MNSSLLVKSHLYSYLGPCVKPEDAFPILAEQIQLGDDLQDRKNMTGHVTSSFMLISPCKTKVLMIHHKHLNKWLCPGGHYEGEVAPRISALRELEEETGYPADKVTWLHPSTYVALDIDSHIIPANPNKDEGEHYHHDFLYVGLALEDFDPQPQEEEVHAAEWKTLDEAEQLPNARVVRAIGKVRKLL